MARILSTFNNTLETIARPVTRQVARSVGGFFGINKDTKIFNEGIAGSIPLPQSLLDPEKQQANGTTGLIGINIAFDEVNDERTILTTALTQREHRLIFNDEALGVYVQPIYAKTTNTITFTVRFDSRSAAMRWQSMIGKRLNQAKTDALHVIEYHWEFPAQTYDVLSTIHELREKNAGYGEDRPTYFANHFKKKLSSFSDNAGNTQVPTMRERQKHVTGYWKFNEVPELEKENDAAERWSLTFEYSFNYDKPIGLATHYPIMIHNQLMPSKYIPSMEENTDDIIAEDDYGSLTQTLLSGFVEANNMLGYKGINIPHWDDWMPVDRNIKSLSDMATVLCSVSENDKRSLFKLNELPGYEFEPDIWEYIRANKDSLLSLFDNAFHVVVYEDNVFAGNNKYEITNDMLLRATVDMDLRKTYRVRVTILRDIWNLTNNAKDILRHFPKACVKILDSLEPNLRKEGLLPSALSTRIPKYDLEQALYYIRYKSKNTRLSWMHALPTVNSIIIEADHGRNH
jgi:hypothetical protein